MNISFFCYQCPIKNDTYFKTDPNIHQAIENYKDRKCKLKKDIWQFLRYINGIVPNMWLYCCDTECQICHEHQISREIPAQPRPGSPTHTIPPTVDILSLHLEFKFRDIKLATLLYLGYHPLVCRKHRIPSRPED